MSPLNWVGVAMLVAAFVHGPMLWMGFRPEIKGELSGGIGSPQFFRQVFTDTFLVMGGAVLICVGH